jgi:uncharacterized Fe-S cluster protein YjdI
MTKHEFKTDKILLTFDDEVCVNSGACIRQLPAVFDVTRDPWINIDGADADAIEAAVDLCPSGALDCEITD